MNQEIIDTYIELKELGKREGLDLGPTAVAHLVVAEQIRILIQNHGGGTSIMLEELNGIKRELSRVAEKIEDK